MNKELDRMTSFIVMDVLERAKEMERGGVKDIIHLEVGEPDFDMPKCVAEAAKRALENGETHYTHSMGMEELRTEIAKLYEREYGVVFNPEQVVVTSGSSPAILLVLMTLCDEGDEVILSNPGYACYANFVRACHGVPVEVAIKAEEGFEYKLEAVKKAITKKTRAIFCNSPMNPTGTLLSEETLKGLVETGVPVISDEIYHGLVYEGKAHSILEYTENAFVLNGFSKRFAMTGMRLGYLIAPKAYMRKLQILQQNLFICAPSVAQVAGITALREGREDTERMRETYDERRKYMVNALREMGVKVSRTPQGAFYVFGDVSEWTDNVYDFAFEILKKTHVAVTPGVDFGSLGEGYIRFSYANSLDNIKEAMARLREKIFRS